MDEVKENVAAEKQRVETTLAELTQALNKKEWSVLELAGMATFLLNIYNGVENILGQVLKAEGVRLKATEAWHSELLSTVETRGIISRDLRLGLQPYLGFRHFFVHGYGYMLEQAPLLKLAENIPEIWSRLITQVEKHLAQ